MGVGTTLVFCFLLPAIFFSLLLERLAVMGANAVIPAEAGIRFFEIVGFYNLLDARLRGHDELCPSLRRGRVGVNKEGDKHS